MHTTKICQIVNQIELRFDIVWKTSNGINKNFMQLKNYNIRMSCFAENVNLASIHQTNYCSSPDRFKACH